jgi:hypothetical protein
MKILNYMTPKQIFQLNSVAIASWMQAHKKMLDFSSIWF